MLQIKSISTKVQNNWVTALVIRVHLFTYIGVRKKLGCKNDGVFLASWHSLKQLDEIGCASQLTFEHAYV